ncbi:MAG: hypothetical protein H7318_05570 [Oligoflexus sp.]|nr:hypothetical protein [Oligoflexus sp.]
MSATMKRHPLLQELHEARKGVKITTEMFLANRALVGGIWYPEPFQVNPARIAHSNKMDSIDVSTVLAWYVDSGFFDKVNDSKGNECYVLTWKWLAIFPMEQV